MMIRLTSVAVAMALTTMAAQPVEAQTRLRFAHVYEVNEPYHTEALWAAEEIAKRTENRWRIEVFPASALGNEPAINEALTLGAIDMIYTGTAFAGSRFRPIAISNAPYVFRDFDHWLAYRDSDLLKELMAGYDRATGHKTLALTYYGARHVTANKPIMKPEDMRGMKLRVPQAPLYLMFARSVGANATPIAFAEVYLALQNGTVDGQENPLPTIQAGKFNEVQKYLVLTGHIITPRLVVINEGFWKGLSAADQKIVKDALDEAIAWQNAEIQKAEASLVDTFKKGGVTVIEPDIAAFRKATLDAVPPKFAKVWGEGTWEKIQAVK